MAAFYRGFVWNHLRTSRTRGASQFSTICQHRYAQVLNVKPSVPKVRLALPSDFEAVMAMNSEDANFRRQDYMGPQYMKYLEDPNLRCLLVVVHGQPVIFGIGQFGVDEGKTVIVRSLRGHQEVRNKGYALHLFKTLVEIDPKKTVVGYTARDPQSSKALSGVLNQLEHRNEHHYLAMESGLKAKTSEICLDHDLVRQLSVHEFCDLFSDEELKEYLYPNKYIVMDTLIAQPMDANRKYFLERADNIAIFSSNSLFPKDSAQNSHQPKGIISYNTWYPCPAGFISKIELYGRVDTAEDVRSHLMAHTRVLQVNGLWGEVKVTMARDRLALHETELKDICEGAGLTCHETPVTKRIVMEGTQHFGSRLDV